MLEGMILLDKPHITQPGNLGLCIYLHLGQHFGHRTTPRRQHCLSQGSKCLAEAATRFHTRSSLDPGLQLDKRMGETQAMQRRRQILWGG